MRSICRLAVSALVAISQVGLAAQLRYLGEIGHLGTQFDRRTSVTFGEVRVTLLESGGARVQGKDDDGNQWSASVAIGQGVGFTDVWQADFDRNRRQDLLIAAYTPQNGRCVNGITLSFLLFNEHGEPVPWVIETRVPAGKREPAIPAIFSDLEHDGRLRLIVTDCSYSSPPRFGEDRAITGVYVAENATWRLIRPANIADYVALVRRSHRFRPNHDELLATDSIRWLDQGNTIDPNGAPPVRLKTVLAASPDCLGIRIPIVNGRVERLANDPCDVLGKARMELSDGAVCFGWPIAVIDRRNGREIVAAPNQLHTALQQLVDEQRTVFFAGQTEPERCSPTIVWAVRQ